MKSLQMTYLELQIEYWLQILVTQAIRKVYFPECTSLYPQVFSTTILTPICVYISGLIMKKRMDIVFWLELQLKLSYLTAKLRYPSSIQMNTQNTHALFTSFIWMMCRAPGLSSAIVAPRSALQGTKCGTYIRRVAQAKVDAFMLSELFSQIKSAVLMGFEACPGTGVTLTLQREEQQRRGNVDHKNLVQRTVSATELVQFLLISECSGSSLMHWSQIKHTHKCISSQTGSFGPNFLAFLPYKSRELVIPLGYLIS